MDIILVPKGTKLSYEKGPHTFVIGRARASVTTNAELLEADPRDVALGQASNVYEFTFGETTYFVDAADVEVIDPRDVIDDG